MKLDARHVNMLEAMGVRVWPAGDTPTAEPHDTPVVTTVARTAPASGAPNTLAVPPAVAAPQPQTPQHPISSLDWAALQEAVRGCQRCGLCDHRKQTVFGVGAAPGGASAPRVDWLIVGEAPGEQEDLAGEPFVGPAGKLLDNMLAALGLSRHEPRQGGVYILNTLKCRPPGNRNPSVEELAACAPYLHRQIELLQPKVILAMGRFAAQSLLAPTVPEVEKLPLGRLRGQRHRWGNIPLVVSYHPAYLLRSLADKAKAWEDLVLAQQILRGPA